MPDEEKKDFEPPKTGLVRRIVGQDCSVVDDEISYGELVPVDPSNDALLDDLQEAAKPKAKRCPHCGGELPRDE